MLNRRSFLLSTTAALRAAGEPKRIAAIVTEYRPNSHADVIVGKYLEGYRQDGRPPQPRSRIVSLYTGRAVPVFNDKHLSYSWGKARRMVEISRQLNFPMLAGSSVPVAYRKPQVETPLGAPIRHAVAIGYSGLEVYGFHMLESLQCMVERRSKGETGVAAVRCLENDAVWK